MRTRCWHAAARRCDRTELAGGAKLYLPISAAPASQRPFASVLQLTGDAEDESLLREKQR